MGKVTRQLRTLAVAVGASGLLAMTSTAQADGQAVDANGFTPALNAAISTMQEAKDFYAAEQNAKTYTTVLLDPTVTKTGGLLCENRLATLVIASSRPAGFRGRFVNAKAKVVKGTAHKDVMIDLSSTKHVINAGAGNDDVCSVNARDIINAGTGDDVVRGGAAQHGGDGDDILIAGPNTVAQYGERGNDLFVDSKASTKMVGGPGINIADFELDPAVNVNLTRGTATGSGKDHVIGVQGVIASKHAADKLVGGPAGTATFLDPNSSAKGADSVTTGKGTTYVSFGMANSAKANLTAGTGTTTGLASGHVSLHGISHAIGSRGTNTISTGARYGVVFGGIGGSNNLSTGAGGGLLDGGPVSASVLISGGGTTFFPEGTVDRITASATRTDTLSFAFSSSTGCYIDFSQGIAGGDGEAYLAGQFSTVAGSNGDDDVVTAYPITVDTGPGDDTVVEQNPGDVVNAGPGTNQIVPPQAPGG